MIKQLFIFLGNMFFLACLTHHPSLYGQVWTPQTSNTGRDLHTIFFVDSQTGWAMGESSGGDAAGNIRHTHDQGQNWNTQFLGQENSEFNRNFFFNSQRGVAVGRHSSGHEDGLFARTEDGGNTWIKDIHFFENELMDVHFSDSLHGWIVGEEGDLYRSTDAGLSWAQVNSPTDEDLFGVYFLNMQEGIVVGEEGRIYRTSNSGTSWTRVNSDTDRDLLSVTFFGNDHGWAVGDNGTIVATTNGGMTWSRKAAGTSRRLTDVSFVSASTGWVVGKYGEVIHTTDGGQSWNQQNSGTGTHIRSVFMVNDSLGWFCGDDGVLHIYRPSSSGSPSGLQASFISNTPVCMGDTIQFADQSTGGVVSWTWDFGDNQGMATDSSPAYSYNQSGNYIVRLIVNDSLGNADTAFSQLSVRIASIQVSPATAVICGPTDSVELVASGGVSYVWSPASGLNDTTGQEVLASPASDMAYTVLGTDTLGCVGVATVNVSIDSTAAPVAAFLPSQTLLCGSDTISFLNQSLFARNYSWVFPGGQPDSSMDINPQVLYDLIGFYDVSLIAHGCTSSDTLRMDSLIEVGPLVMAGFVPSVDTVDLQNNQAVDFLDMSVNPVQWLWDFGTGDTSTQQNPSYTFIQSGIFDVQLIVANGSCADTARASITVVDSLPVMRTMRINMVIAPNPLIDRSQVAIRGVGASPYQLQIWDFQGILRIEETNIENRTFFLDRQTLPAGMYIYRLVSADQSSTTGRLLVR